MEKRNIENTKKGGVWWVGMGVLGERGRGSFCRPDADHIRRNRISRAAGSAGNAMPREANIKKKIRKMEMAV